MSGLATRRLIDAAATLDPADRALLNLWVNRGLDDERLAGLTGLSIQALQRRRGRIVAGLSAELGLPESHVRAALEQISPDDVALVASGANGHVAPVVPVAPVAQATRDESPPAPAAPVSPEASDAPVAEPAPRRRRRVWLGLAGLAVIVAAVLVIVASRGSSSPTSTPRPRARTRPTNTATTTTPTPAPPVASPHPSGGPVPAPLAGLPGGLAHTSGSVELSGPRRHLMLNLRVRGLPAAHAGHYEVWLYNSVLDSRPLGRLRTGHATLTTRLPGNTRRFRWIDISFQPAGVLNHSGESELRASNPAHTTKARLRRPAARTRHRLRPPTKVSAGRPAAHRPATHRRRTRARARRAGGRRPHPRRRTARGSSRAKTS